MSFWPFKSVLTRFGCTTTPEASRFTFCVSTSEATPSSGRFWDITINPRSIDVKCTGYLWSTVFGGNGGAREKPLFPSKRATKLSKCRATIIVNQSQICQNNFLDGKNHIRYIKRSGCYIKSQLFNRSHSLFNLWSSMQFMLVYPLENVTMPYKGEIVSVLYYDTWQNVIWHGSVFLFILNMCTIDVMSWNFPLSRVVFFRPALGLHTQPLVGILRPILQWIDTTGRLGCYSCSMGCLWPVKYYIQCHPG